MAEEARIKAYRYEDLNYTWNEKNQNDITHLDLLFTVKHKYTGEVIFQKSVGSGITILTNPNYRAIISVSSTDLNLEPDEYVYVVSAANVGAGRVYSFGVFEVAEPGVGNRP